MLYAISSDTKQEYDASRELRSGKHDNETVTLLYRLANRMEQRWRSKARARLKLVLKFRNASVPRFNKPLKLSFLAHTQFKTNVQKFLADLIRQHRHVLVPYHLPTKTVQEMPRQTLSKALWNHKRTIADLGRDSCQCQEFAKKHPRVQLTTTPRPCRHRLRNPQPAEVSRHLQQRRSRQRLLPFRKLKQEHLDQFQSWIFDKEWLLHRQQLETDPRLTHRLVKHIISIFRRSTSSTTKITPTLIS